MRVILLSRFAVLAIFKVTRSAANNSYRLGNSPAGSKRYWCAGAIHETTYAKGRRAIDFFFSIIYSQKIILYISDLEKLARSRNLPVIAAVGAKAERDVFGCFHRLCGIEVRQRYAERPYTPRRGEARLKKIDAELLDDRDVIASVQEAARNLPDWRI